MLYSTVERRRREMNVKGGVSDDTETDPHYSPKERDMSEDNEVTLGEVYQSTDGESESGEEVRVGGEKKVQPASKIKSPEKNQ